MGNLFSSSSQCSDNSQPEDPTLTKADKAAYTAKRATMFKFTIALCVIYGAIVLLIFLMSIMSQNSGQYFMNSLKPFTLTFAGGIIFVIIVLIYQIYTFKATPLSISAYDNDLCPDFWKLVPTDTKSDAIYTNVAHTNPNLRGLFNYQCVPDTNVLQSYRQAKNVNGQVINPYGQTINNPQGPINNQYLTVDATDPNVNANITNTDALTKLLGSGNNGVMTQITTNNWSPSASVGAGNVGANKLVCDKIFPNYLASANAKDPKFANVPNAFACTYAEACGVPWAGLCGK
jgi:hypothetical protein